MRVSVTVVSRQARLRWSAVLCGAALLCALPALIAALPVPRSPVTAAALRARILASARVPYQGYVNSTASLGLPPLPHLAGITDLLDGSTDQYAWYRSPGRWRAEVVTGTGETDTYQAGQATYLGSYWHNLFTKITGAQPARLPRPADLLPPALARRLLGLGTVADHLSRLPARRVAGVDAAGLRLSPADPASTVAAIDVWADPGSGLPVRVEITARGSSQPVLVSQFLALSQRRPALATVTPDPSPAAGFTTAREPDVNSVLNTDGDGDHDGTPFPARLAGLGEAAIPGGLPGVAVYGDGFTRFALLPLPGQAGQGAASAAARAGAATVSLSGQTGTVIRTPLLTVVLVTAGFRHTTFLLTGAVTPGLLERAGSGLVTGLRIRR